MLINHVNNLRNDIAIVVTVKNSQLPTAARLPRLAARPYILSSQVTQIPLYQSMGESLFTIAHTYTHASFTHSQFVIVLHFLVQGSNTVVTPTHSETRHQGNQFLVALCMVPSKHSKCKKQW